MKRNGFFVLGMLALTLTFGLVLAGCDNGTNGTPDGGGGTQINRLSPGHFGLSGKGYISLYGDFELDWQQSQSTLPGFSDSFNPEKDAACGFSVTTTGTALTVTKVIIYGETISINVDRRFTDGENLTVSYTPDGTHIFKDSDGNELRAFTLSGTYEAN